jgi:hypothetical protein
VIDGTNTDTYVVNWIRSNPDALFRERESVVALAMAAEASAKEIFDSFRILIK